MAQDKSTRAADAGSAAMEKALQAEEQALEAIKGCERQAEEVREEARDAARRIADRADRRISWAHDHSAEVLQRELADIQAADGPATAGQPRTDAALLRQAADRLAERLTTPEPSEEAGSG